MNFLNVFEERISSLFTATAADASPISFKKLAKEASKELQNETYVINGVDTAPALFTILINGSDNKQMAAIQADLANETALYLEAAGKRKKYKFVGKPLVRFMVDTSLKPGKFSVFAENVDVNALEKLRAEENRYLGGAPGAAREQVYGDEFDAIGSAPVTENDAELEEDIEAEVSARPARGSRLSDAAAAPKSSRRNGSRESRGASRAAVAGAAAAGAGVAAAGAGAAGAAAAAGAASSAAGPSGQAPKPTSRAKSVSLVNPGAGAPQAQQAQKASVPPEHTAMLIDRQTGQTFTCTADECIIGRERSAGGIVLPNPNISRQHAKLSFNGRYWAIEDLNSTNGTLVNNVDVQKKRLITGDVVTLGLTNLEFMES